jgi:hypothetical protein
MGLEMAWCWGLGASLLERSWGEVVSPNRRRDWVLGASSLGWCHGEKGLGEVIHRLAQV